MGQNHLEITSKCPVWIEIDRRFWEIDKLHRVRVHLKRTIPHSENLGILVQDSIDKLLRIRHILQPIFGEIFANWSISITLRINSIICIFRKWQGLINGLTDVYICITEITWSLLQFLKKSKKDEFLNCDENRSILPLPYFRKRNKNFNLFLVNIP